MIKTKKGLFAKDGTPVEFTVDRYSTYNDLMSKCSDVLAMPPIATGMNRSLFTSGGALIKENPDWILDIYLKQVKKGSIKIGIGDMKVRRCIWYGI